MEEGSASFEVIGFLVLLHFGARAFRYPLSSVRLAVSFSLRPNPTVKLPRTIILRFQCQSVALPSRAGTQPKQAQGASGVGRE